MKNLLKEVIGNIYGMGVYCFESDGKVLYVGSGMMNDRLQSHLYNLKRGLYEGTNKGILQDEYNLGELSFRVLHFSENNSEYINGSKSVRKTIQEVLEILEQFYYNMYKDTCCNTVTKIRKFSTSPTKKTTELRRNKNKGSMNPNNRYDEDLVANILYLKERGLKPREIIELLEDRGIDVTSTYVGRIGVDRWIHLESKCPDWYKKIETIEVKNCITGEKSVRTIA